MIEDREAEQRRADNEAAIASENKRRTEVAAFQAAAEKARAEAAAQRDPKEALPLRIDASVGLAYVPKVLHEQYRHGMDGAPRLEWISSDDLASMAAYQKEIAAGKLRVVHPGDSPELQRLRAEHAKARTAEVHALLNKQARRVEDAKIEAERKKLQAQIDRLEEARRQHRSV